MFRFDGFKILGFFVLSTGLLSCGRTQFASKPNEEVFGQRYEYSSKVDILWVVDTSESMNVHQDHISNQFSSFVDQLIEKKMDFQLAITTMDMGSGGEKGEFVGSPAVLTKRTPNVKAEFSNRIRLGDSGSSLERGLSAVLAALSDPLLNTVNSGFLRVDSLLAVIFISNEDDRSSASPTDVAEFLNEVRPPSEFGDSNWVANYIGISEPDGFCKTQGQYVDPGDRFMELVNLSEGISEDICNDDLSGALSNIRKRIVSRLTQFRLKDEPIVETIKVYLNNRSIPKSEINGWTYIEAKRSIRFHGDAIPAADDDIKVKYEIVR